MASVFISHSSRDRTITERVVARLRSVGLEALFVDFDREQGIPAGREWEPELYSQLRRADAVIFLATESSVASRWCFAELSLARSLKRPVFPLRLQPGADLPLIADVQWLDFTDVEAGLDRLPVILREAGLDSAEGFAWDASRSPYPGLAPFTAEDAAVFFGRERETARLLELLQPTLLRGPGRFVAVVGPSGSGKSSLVLAGLLPRLARDPHQWVILPPFRPGSEPTRSLAVALQQAFVAHGHQRPVDELAAQLMQGPAALADLCRELIELAVYGTARPNVLVVIDQAEELVTRTGEAEQRAFLRLLREALGETSPVWAVATVRSEFLSSAPDRAGLAEAVDDPLIIEPLSRDRLAEVIARPAQRADLDFAPGLIERMVAETAGGDALPLLAYTLQELCGPAAPGSRISIADYDAIGGVVGSLRHRADQLADALTRRGHGALVVPTLLQLAALTGEEQPTRRRVKRAALHEEEQAVIDAFVDARLLTSTTDATGAGIVEVAHEALLRQWPPLREAIEADRAGLRLRSDLEKLVADWQQGSRDASYLLRGGRLARIDEWAAGHPGELGAAEQEFLQASRGLAARELETTKRSNRRLRTLAGGLALLLVAALVAGGLAFSANREAQAQTRRALSRQLAAQLPSIENGSPDLALLLAIEAYQRAPSDDQPERRDALLALLSHPYSRKLINESPTTSVAFTTDGRTLASLDWKEIRLWEVATGQLRRTLIRPSSCSADQGIAFSPDDRLLANSCGGAVAVWDVTGGKLAFPPLAGHAGRVWGVAFSPDGRLIASAGEDKTVRLWTAATGKPAGPPLTGHTDQVRSVAFSPDGTTLASTGYDGTVRQWDVATGKPKGPTYQQGCSSVVRFSHSGRTLACGDLGGDLRLWDTTTGTLRWQQPSQNNNRIEDVSFSPDNTTLAAASADGSVRLWDTALGSLRGQPLTGHAGSVDGVTFSPDGTILASASADRTVRLWQTAPAFGRVLRGHTRAVTGVTFGPDNRLLASASEDGTARLWDADTGQWRGQPLPSDLGPMDGVTVSPNGALLATAESESTLGGESSVQLWDADSGQRRGSPLTGYVALVKPVFSPDGQFLALASGGTDGAMTLTSVADGHRRPIGAAVGGAYAAAFSPDGKTLAFAGEFGGITLWDIAAGKAEGQPLIGHAGAVMALAFSPDGTTLASSGNDGTIRLWDPATGKPRGQPLTGHSESAHGSKAVSALAFSPDGRLLASGGDDGTVRLWELASGQPDGEVLVGHAGEVKDIAFRPDGRMLASAGADGDVRVWNLGDQDAVAAACRLAGRNLSQSEWNQFIGPQGDMRPTCPSP